MVKKKAVMRAPGIKVKNQGPSKIPAFDRRGENVVFKG
jgi:hypothetical protein